MCGIFGIYNLEGTQNFDQERVKKSIQKMSHRGPDYFGLQTFENKAVLAHLRLAIIDLVPDSNQPFEWEDRYYVSYNGEIYNYIELKEDLMRLGYKFRTKSDTEVLVAAYQEWGKKCVNYFNGMWAFVIYDKWTNELFGSRDRFGVKPFNYSKMNGQFVFSSEIKSILEYFPDARIPNYNVISNFCRNSIGAQIKETWFTNIFRLEPAHNLFVSNEGIKIEQYWDYPRVTNKNISFDDAVATYRNLFINSVEIRMRSDVPVGFTLSSGIDSMSIVSVLRNHLNGNNKTYTAAFPNNNFLKSEKQNYKKDIEIDEAKLVISVAGSLGLNPTIVDVDFTNYVDELTKIIYSLESGHGSPAVFPLNSIFNIATKDITVVLEGQGADELLAGYVNNVESIYFFELIKKFQFKKAIIELNAYCKIYSISSLVMLFVRQINSGWIHKLYYKLTGINSFYIGKLNKYVHIKDYPKKGRGFDSSVNAHLFESHTGGLVNLLHYGDAISMAYSLESRLPFMDYRLVEFVFSLPSIFKIKRGMGKHIHRKAMEGIVPDEILSHKIKYGFSTPLSQLFLEKGNNSPAAILLSKKCIERGLFSEKAIRKSLSDLERGKKDRTRFLYRMLNVELWFREFVDLK
jgi:asparagine synthase (glutamine-hydrolysing)